MVGASIRVLLVVDRPALESPLRHLISQSPTLELLGVARTIYEARDSLVLEQPDLVILDAELRSEKVGFFVERYMRVLPVPSIICTTGPLENFRVPRPDLIKIMQVPVGITMARWGEFVALMGAAIENLLGMELQFPASDPGRTHVAQAHNKVQNLTADKLIAIGASLGGRDAMCQILSRFPADTPPVLLVGHLPENDDASFDAKVLNAASKMRVSVARNGKAVKRGHVYVAPGGVRHMEVYEDLGSRCARVRLVPGPLVMHCRPSVDVFLNSVARLGQWTRAAAVLTGMGSDGARGLKAVRESGGRTFVQDEQSSYAAGMPGRAWEMGGAEKRVPLDSMATTLLLAVQA